MNILETQQRAKAGRQPGWVKMVSVIAVVALLHVAAAPVITAAEIEPPELSDNAPRSDDRERAESTGSQYGLGAASVFLSIPYGLGKFLFATIGGLCGGFTYIFSGGNARAAKSVWDTSMRGTYIITPDHLRGDRTVRFLGVPREGDQAEPENAQVETLPVEPAPGPGTGTGTGTEPPPLK